MRWEACSSAATATELFVGRCPSPIAANIRSHSTARAHRRGRGPARERGDEGARGGGVRGGEAVGPGAAKMRWPHPEGGPDKMTGRGRQVAEGIRAFTATSLRRIGRPRGGSAWGGRGRLVSGRGRTSAHRWGASGAAGRRRRSRAKSRQPAGPMEHFVKPRRGATNPKGRWLVPSLPASR